MDGGDGRVIAVDLRAILSLQQIAHRPVDEIFRRVVVQAHVHRRVRLLEFGNDFQNNVREWVDGRRAIGVTPSDRKRLHPSIRRANTLMEFDEQLADEFRGRFARDLSGGELRFQIRPQVVVESARTVPAVRVLKHHREVLEMKRLHGFPKAGGRVLGDAVAEICHRLKFLAPSRIRFFFGSLSQGNGMAAHPDDKSIQHYLRARVVLNRLRIIGLLTHDATPLDHTPRSPAKHLSVIPPYVSGVSARPKELRVRGLLWQLLCNSPFCYPQNGEVIPARVALGAC